MTTYPIQNIRLQAGSKPGTSSLAFAPGPLTVFVGPNGSGKSAALREIEALFRRQPVTPKVVGDLSTHNYAGPEEVLETIPGLRREGRKLRAPYVNIDADSFSSLHRNQDWLHGVFGPAWCIRLDGTTRLTLVKEQQSGDLLDVPQNHLQALFQNDDDRKRLRGILAESLGKHFVIDPTHTGRLRVRLSTRPPVDDAEEQSYDARARAFHAAAPLIDEASDGVRAFTGLLSAVFANRHRVLLIDEPEAFLHPPLARRLGFRLSELSHRTTANVFVATHSADFLMGCVQSGVEVNIVRLTYEGGASTARMISGPTVAELMKDPLLRSTGVLSALFHNGADDHGSGGGFRILRGDKPPALVQRTGRQRWYALHQCPK